MDKFFLVEAGGQARPARLEPGLSLAQNLFIAGALADRPLCSGLGCCGLCRVRYVGDPPPPLPKELTKLSRSLLDRGYRLACQRRPEPGDRVLVPARPVRAKSRVNPETDPEVVLGVDLGTTSLQWRLARHGRTLAEGSGPNPQLAGGAEVMSRLALARSPGGAARLRQVVLDRLRDMVSGLPVGPGLMVLAGNPAMTCLALGLDCPGLMGAPYRLDYLGQAMADLGPGLPRTYVPPLWAPFVGADLSAGYAALVQGPASAARPFLLADLGTNGEFVLAVSPDEIYAASLPMGPALEGVGMTQGRLAGPGAAVAFAASPVGLSPVLYGQNAPGGQPRGVSGTGYISLMAKLLSLGVLDRDGRFAQAASPLAGKVLAGLVRGPGQARLDVGGVSLWAEDVEALLKVKAAFNAALSLLLDAAKLPFSALKGLYLAGALGGHAGLDDLETLGFLPPGGQSRTRIAGNTSLDGACLLGQRPEARDWLGGQGASVRLVEVAQDQNFKSLYIKAMRFEHV